DSTTVLQLVKPTQRLSLSCWSTIHSNIFVNQHFWFWLTYNCPPTTSSPITQSPNPTTAISISSPSFSDPW
ncbi:uncharacterized protein J3R85_020965, partial [Psidium guajava]